MINFKLERPWNRYLGCEYTKPYFSQLSLFLTDQFSNSVVFPSMDNVFTAFNLTPFEKIKVVILGQDPYHGKGQAQGLAFSVPEGMPLPPSLRNILLEYHDDLGYVTPSSGDLSKWAEEGVNMRVVFKNNATNVKIGTSEFLPIATEWTESTGEITIPDGVTDLLISLWNGSQTHFYFDDISFKEKQ